MGHRLGHQDCMQSRQEYTLAVKKKKKKTRSEGDSLGGAEVCGVLQSYGERCPSQRHIGDACGVLRTDKERCFGPAACGRGGDGDRWNKGARLALSAACVVGTIRTGSSIDTVRSSNSRDHDT